VAPLKPDRLRGPQSGERKRGDQGSPSTRSRCRPCVKRTRRVEQRDDLRRRVEVNGPRLVHLQSPALPGSRVPRDEVVLDRDLEERRDGGRRLEDRRRLRRPPQSAAHISKHVLELLLSTRPSPAVGARSECDELPLTVGVEAERVDPAALAFPDYDLTLSGTR